jgi:hypothetical protein
VLPACPSWARCVPLTEGNEGDEEGGKEDASESDGASSGAAKHGGARTGEEIGRESGRTQGLAEGDGAISSCQCTRKQEEASAAVSSGIRESDG